jgi:hypothetical protein
MTNSIVSEVSNVAVKKRQFLTKNNFEATSDGRWKYSRCSNVMVTKTKSRHWFESCGSKTKTEASEQLPAAVTGLGQAAPNEHQGATCFERLGQPEQPNGYTTNQMLFITFIL